jgi:hypothetical protein
LAIGGLTVAAGAEGVVERIQIEDAIIRRGALVTARELSAVVIEMAVVADQRG